jgi:hypothetical protein
MKVGDSTATASGGQDNTIMVSSGGNTPLELVPQNEVCFWNRILCFRKRKITMNQRHSRCLNCI